MEAGSGLFQNIDALKQLRVGVNKLQQISAHQSSGGFSPASNRGDRGSIPEQ